MKKRVIILALLFLVVIFIASCDRSSRCAKDLKICPGGATVARVGPSCGFASCPDVVCTVENFTCPEGTVVKRVPPYCNFEECPKNNTYMFIGGERVSLLCSSDEDCTLIRPKYGFSCCYTGVCDVYDYANRDFVAVNKNDFDRLRNLNCPHKENCGPAPVCSLRVVNEQITAKCVGGVCVKPYGYPDSYYYS